MNSLGIQWHLPPTAPRSGPGPSVNSWTDTMLTSCILLMISLMFVSLSNKQLENMNNEPQEQSFLHQPGISSNPFGREHSLSLYRKLRKSLYRVFADEFRHGVGGIAHLWVFQAVISRENISWPYYIFLSYCYWHRNNGQDIFTGMDFSHSGWSHSRVRLLLYDGVKLGHIKRYKQGKFTLTYKGVRYYERVARMLFNAVADVYATLEQTKNPGKLPGLST